MSQAQRIAIGSIFVGVVVLALKALAWWITGSIAILSDALESVVNIATAVVALLAVRMAATPADARHPYGHHKAELLSAILAAALIIVAAIVILNEAVRGFMAPRPLEAPLSGLVVNALASVVNAVWCRVLIVHGRRLRSPALVADGRHLLTDVVSSVGVTAGVLLAVLTGWALLDPLLAAAVALTILWSGWRLMRENISGLMDEALPEPRLAELRKVIGKAADGAVEVHDLRTRHAGSATFIEFHLVVPRAMTVEESHDICDRIERAIRREIAGAMITIHVEPDPKVEDAPCIRIADGGEGRG